MPFVLSVRKKEFVEWQCVKSGIVSLAFNAVLRALRSAHLRLLTSTEELVSWEGYTSAALENTVLCNIVLKMILELHQSCVKKKNYAVGKSKEDEYWKMFEGI